MNLKPIRKSVRRIRGFLKEVPDNPDPQTVKNLRTSTRRLEAAFHAFGLAARDGQKSKLLHDLRHIRKEAGKVRDLDVFTEQALGLEAQPDEQECLLIVIEHLGASRIKQAKKLRAVARKVSPRLRHELKLAWSGLQLVLEPKKGAGAASAAKQAHARALETEAQLTETLCPAPQLNRNNLHHHRLQIKELRYLLQLQDRPNQRELVDKLIEVQDAIGAWHDSEELMAIAKDLLKHGPECQLLQAMKTSVDTKYERALEATRELSSANAETSGPREPEPFVELAGLSADRTMVA